MARILGLDIGTAEVRATMVRTTFRKVEVERYVQVPLTEAPASRARAIEIKEALQGMLRVLDEVPDVAVADLPGDAVSLRTVRLPMGAAKHISEVLPFELESLLPVPVEELIIDYQPIETTPQELHLLVASALHERVAERLRELQGAGIDPRDLAAGAAALDGLASLLPELQQEGPVLIVEIGRSRTDLCFLRAGRCQLARSLSMGIDKLSEGSDDFWRGIQRTIASYRAAGGAPLERVYAAGQGAVMPGAVAWLAERLEMDVEPLPLPRAPNADAASRPLFGRSAALAGRGVGTGKRINLRRGEFAPKGTVGALRRNAVLLGICAAAVLMSMVFSIYARRSLLLDEQEVLKQRLASVTEDVFGVTTSDPSQVEKLLTNPGQEDPLPRFDAFDALDALSDSVPPDVTHDVTRLRIELDSDKHEGRMELRGKLGSIEQRDDLATQLEQHQCFHKVERGRTTPARQENQINYQLEATVRCPGDAWPKKKDKTRRIGRD